MSVSSTESGPRRILGREAALVRNLTASTTIPTASTFRTFEVSSVVDWRSRARDIGRRVPLSALFASALAHAAVTAVPTVLRRLDDGPQGLVMWQDSAVNLGVAVDVETASGRTVLVPVIRGADALELAPLIERLEAMATSAREGTLTVADMQGANLLLTSTGKFGSSGGVPLLPRGVSMIVAASAIGVPPGMERLAEVAPVDPVLTLSATYDHRVVHGADASRFLAAVQDLMQSRPWLESHRIVGARDQAPPRSSP